MIIRSNTSGGVAAGYNRKGDKRIIALFVPAGGGRTNRLELSLGIARGAIDALTQAVADADAAPPPDRYRGGK